MVGGWWRCRVLSAADYARLRTVRLALISFAKVQIVACQPLLHAFREHDLKYSLLKGGATAFLLYPEPHMRGAWDIDIGVDLADLKKAEALANKFGYVSAQQDRNTNRFFRADPKLKASVEAGHYELGFLVRRLEVTNLPPATIEAIRSEPFTHQYWFDVENDFPCCYASVDIHHAISLDIPLRDLLAYARTVSFNSDTLRVPDNAWLMAHLVFKIYWEGVHNYGKCLYEYADLIRLVPRIDDHDFHRLVEDSQDFQSVGSRILRVEAPRRVPDRRSGKFRALHPRREHSAAAGRPNSHQRFGRHVAENLGAAIAWAVRCHLRRAHPTAASTIAIHAALVRHTQTAMLSRIYEERSSVAWKAGP